MNRKIWLTSLVVIAVLLIAFFLFPSSKNETAEIAVPVTRGPFEVLVFASGQLEAQNSENIVVPEELKDRQIRIYEIKITDLIEEGTVVDSGDYVATLDQKAVEEELNKAIEDMDQALNNFEDAKMDSNLNLSNFRDQITNAKEQLEESQIILEESKYESPAVIRKAEMDMEKAKRKLEQEIKGYALKERQAVSKVERSKIELREREVRLRKLEDALDALIITAPKGGMLMYGPDRNGGGKMKVGSTVYTYMPNIAELPDLTSMLSTTFVNEIDISNVKKGQKVTLGVDAIPEKVMEGEVVAVANIGQQMPKSDAKVFEVKIRIFGDVSDLKPSMTTSNTIQTATYADTLYIPTEAVFENDSLQFVYLERNKRIKQIVDLGSQNENFVLIRKGLSDGDLVLLNEPDDAEEMEFEGFEIYQEIKKRKAKEEEEARKAIEEDKKRPFKLQNKSSGNNAMGGMIIIG